MITKIKNIFYSNALDARTIDLTRIHNQYQTDIFPSCVYGPIQSEFEGHGYHMGLSCNKSCLALREIGLPLHSGQ